MNKLTVPIGRNDHRKGSTKAHVTLVEYGDYECPYCVEAYPIIEHIFKEKRKSMEFVFRHFPLTQIHPYALIAARAAEAAGMQGKFWEMHAMLFENQKTLDEEYIFIFAQNLKIDLTKFVQDMRSDKVARKVREDFAGGIRSGVNGTPTFFINGIRYNGTYAFEPLLEAITHAEGGKQIAL